MNVLVFFLMLLPAQFGLQGQPKASFTAEFAKESVTAGSTVDLIITAEIEDGWHVYDPLQDPDSGIPVSIDIKSKTFTSAGNLESLQAPKEYILELGADMKLTYLWQEDQAKFKLPVKVGEGVGKKVLFAEVTYQVCDDQQCLPVATLLIKAPIEVESAPLNKFAKLDNVIDSQVDVSASFFGSLAPNEEIEVHLDFKVQDGWYVYDIKNNPELGKPITLEVVGDEVEVVENLSSSIKATSKNIAGDIYLCREGEFGYKAKLKLGSKVPDDLAVRVNWQACTDSICLPLATKTILVSNVLPLNDKLNSAIPEDFWAFIFAAIAAGLATLLTPCVFPMIPVTISYFTKRAEAGKGTPMGNALAYAGGIIFTFAGVGVGAALLIGPEGANAIGANPWVNLAIGILFVALGFSLLGFYEIQPPKFLAKFASNKQAEGQTRAGYFPVTLMAIAFSITAFTCTVGFVGAVFVLGLKLGLSYLIGGMFVYGLTFALPFFFLALFPSRLQSMPNAGEWMNMVKICAGFIELIAALKFFSNSDLYWDGQILTWPVFLWSSAIITFLWALYLIGGYKLPYDFTRPKMTPRRGVFAAVLLFLTFSMSQGAVNRDHSYPGAVLAFLPPKDYGLNIKNEAGHKIGAADLSWIESYEEAFAVAKRKDQPLFVDFTGVTCVNCRRMEYEIFPDPSVKPLLQQMVRAELWVDKPPYGEFNTQLQINRFNQIAQPFYAIIDPRNDETLITFPGYDPNPEKFAAFLRAGLKAYQR